MMKDGHEEIGRIAEFRARESHLVEITHRCFSRTLIDRTTSHQQNEPIKQVENFRVRLMDSHDDCLIGSKGQLFQVAADNIRS